MEDQTIVALANTIATIINGHLSSSATLEAADKAFNAAIISAGASILVGVFSAFFSFYQSKKMIKKDYNKMYKDIVTSEKVRWLNALRETTAEFITIAHSLFIIRVDNLHEQEECRTVYLNFRKENQDLIFKFNKMYYSIQLRLNIEDMDQCAFLIKLRNFHDDILKSKDFNQDTLERKHDKIITISTECQVFMEKEWRKIRNEANNIHMPKDVNDELKL